MMRDELDFVIALINAELERRVELESVIAFPGAGYASDTLLVCAEGVDVQAVSELFSAHVRARQWCDGDVWWLLGTDHCYVGTETVPVRADPEQMAAIVEKHRDSFERHAGRQAVFARVQNVVVPQDADRVVGAIKSRTWFGARVVPPALRTRKIDVKVGLQERVVAWREGQFGCAYAFQGVSYSLACDGATGGASIVVCRPQGVEDAMHVSTEQIMAAIRFDRGPYWGLEVDCGFHVEAVGPISAASGQQWLTSLEFAPEAAVYIRGAYESRFRSNAESLVGSLEERRTAAVRTPHICHGQEMLGKEPRCEIELIILAARMERLIAGQLRTFAILEHTKKFGIDAVIEVALDYQTPARVCMAEFEYRLSNFFLHRHPFKMTDFVICWQLGDVGPAIAAHSITLAGNGWIKYLQMPGHGITVLVLSEFPGLQIAPAPQG